MPVPLNKIPPGLLDFFGIKSGEWGPRVLGQELLPHIDLTRWYLDNYALEVDSVVTASPFAASGNATSLALTSTTPIDLVSTGVIRVPQTEVWLLLEACVRWQFSAHAAQNGDFGWTVGGVHLPMLLSGDRVSSSTIQLAGARSLERPFWAAPGAVIAPFAYQIIVAAGGSITLSETRLRVARFRA